MGINDMNVETDFKTHGTGLMADIKALLVQQFLLHEVEHHAFYAIKDGKKTPAPPVAHTPMDIYKCLHQGEFGVAHTVDDPDRFRDRLYRELSSIQPATREPVLENVAVDGAVLRVNLRPYRALFVDDMYKARDLLTEVCLKSADIPKGSAERFLTLLHGFRDLNKNRELVVGNVTYAFPFEMVDYFLKEVRQLARRLGQIPVFSHSPTYRRLNSPNYRVVDRSAVSASSLAFMLDRQNEPNGNSGP